MTPGPSLSDWYRREVLPRLTAEAVFPPDAIRFRSSGRMRGRCPLHGDEDRASRRFSVDPETLGWKCFSCSKSGDALAFLAGGQSPRGDAYRDAVRRAADLAGIPEADWAGWLARSTPRTRFKPPRSAPKPKLALKHMQAAKARSTASERDSRRAKAVCALWDISGATNCTPAAAYLVEERHVWPPGRPLPAAVRWLPGAALRRVLPGGWSLPAASAGCIAYAFEGDERRALQLDALTAGGRLCDPRWRRNIGSVKGLRFAACDLPGGRVHVGEGPLSALAGAMRCHARGRGAAVAAGPAHNMGPHLLADGESRPVAIHADADAPGRTAAWQLRESLRVAGRECEALGLDGMESDGSDVADALALAIEERRAIRELEAGQSPADALRGAWEDMLEWLRAGGEL